MNEKVGMSFSSKVFLLIGFTFLVSLGFIFFKYGYNFTGFAVTSLYSGFSKTFSQISLASKIVLIGQWVFIISLLTVIFIRTKKAIQGGPIISKMNLKNQGGMASTDLDSLYAILQDKKTLRLSQISKAFHIDKNVAMEWCKILESGNLGVIEYPGIGEPVIKKIVD